LESANIWQYLEYFTRDEFGYAQGVEPSTDLVLRLEQAREIAGVPFVITSGIRSNEHNAAVGGSPGSSHLTGNAVDIACTTSSDRFAILHALIEVGFERIGIGSNFIHVDNDRSKPQGVCWRYDA
jgi:uncharacterized protein YcbK (DUF882 family)